MAHLTFTNAQAQQKKTKRAIQRHTQTMAFNKQENIKDKQIDFIKSYFILLKSKQFRQINSI